MPISPQVARLLMPCHTGLQESDFHETDSVRTARPRAPAGADHAPLAGGLQPTPPAAPPAGTHGPGVRDAQGGGAHILIHPKATAGH